jgi:hypothetical protein
VVFKFGINDGLPDRGARLRVVAVGEDLSGADVLVGAVVEVARRG